MYKTEVTYSLTGRVLKQPIILPNGTILLKEGTILTDQYIEKLMKLKITSVYVGEYDHSSKTSIGSGPSYLREHRLENKTHLTGVYKIIRELANTNEKFHWITDPVQKISYQSNLQSIFYEIAANDDLINLMLKIYLADKQLFHHATNVAVVAGILALAKKYDFQQIIEICIGALISDIGMTEISMKILRKNGNITPEERLLLDEHVGIGYDLVKNKKNIPFRSTLCVLQHHERYDGTGYPNRLKYGQIDEFAQLVSIADVFIALCSPRYHRTSYTKNEVVEFLFATGNKYFSHDLVKHFFKTISIYPISSKVVLSNGQMGIVTSTHHDLVHRPVVKVIMGKDGEWLDSPYEIDLRTNTNLYIVN